MICSKFKNIAIDTIKVEDYYKINHNIYDIDVFLQTWGSTSLGFNGCGGDMMTEATTIIVWYDDVADVFFGGRFAYKIKKDGIRFNRKFLDDVKSKNVASVEESKTRYTNGQ